MRPTESESSKSHHNSARLAAFEVAWIFLIFFLFAGSLPPDVGESHYLVKAKHYWNSTWCAGDLFAESLDAHGTFYWTFGWITKLASLPAAAWIGRVVSWLLLAYTWRRLSWAIVPRPLVSLLSAGLMLLLLKNLHLAGEWIVGGIEAKGFAYPLVFLSLEAIAKNGWRRAIVFAGAAGAFHVLVGGWTVVAIGLAWLMSASDRPRLVTLLPAVAVGFILALPGIIPAIALNWGVPPGVQREAARVYVFERLSHHLVYHAFPASHIARFQLHVLAWAVLAWLLRKDVALCRVQRVTAGAIGISLVGIAIDQTMVWQSNAQDLTVAESAGAQLMRYYWFRLSDAFVPIGVALSIVAVIERVKDWHAPAAAWLQAAAIIAAAASIFDIQYWRARQNVPPAVMQPRPTADSWPRSWLEPWRGAAPANAPTINDWYRDWRAACHWVSTNTPQEAIFLTPREQQTFKWYAGRAEIANWKDVPQDARTLLEWNRRISEIYPRDREHNRHDLAAFSDNELVEIARRYGARYIVVDQTRAGRRLGLPLLYPQVQEDNPSFAVYLVPPQANR